MSIKKDIVREEAVLLKRQGSGLLKKSKLISALKRYGEVKMTGSYRLNLMAEGDIDIHVVNPKMTKETSIKALNRLIRKNFFKAHSFYDFVKFKREDFPVGYYIGLKVPFKERNWKIDIWFIKKDSPNEKIMEYVRKNLDDKLAGKILKLKYWRSLNKYKISSGAIYYEAIRNKKASLNSLKEILMRYNNKKIDFKPLIK